MTEVHVHNDEDIFLIISQKFHMNQIIKYEAEDHYLTVLKDVILVIVIIIFHTSMNEFMKCKLNNSITVYSSHDTVTQIKIIINDYVSL